MPQKAVEDGLIAAVDLGSNSFHLAVARVEHGALHTLEGLSEKVQLGAGLDADNRLSEEAQARALACLSRFAQHLAGVSPKRLRIVGTNALRVAKNSPAFLQEAEKILRHPVEIIAGREEARLIYMGVAHTVGGAGRRLVVDIGGGSTEFIIGEGFEPLATESLHMGCVSYTQRFFADGQIGAKQLDRAIMAASQEIASIAADYQDLGWELALGSSGTIKTVRQVLNELGWAGEKGRISRESLQRLRGELLRYRHVSEVQLPGLKDDRKAIMPAGFAIVSAIFEELDLADMEYSDGALREGVLYDMLGRFGQRDVRDRTVEAFMQRHRVDAEQAKRVTQTALAFYQQVADALGLSDDDNKDLLRRAGLLHEVGLAVSHASFHKHSAYLVRYSDLPGFSRPAQETLAALVGTHRRKIKPEQFSELRSHGPELVSLCVLLRLAVLLHHSRSRRPLPSMSLSGNGRSYSLQTPTDWLSNHPLTRADLEEEASLLAQIGLELHFS